MANAHLFLRVDSFGNVCRLIPLSLSSTLLLRQPYTAQCLPILNIISYLNLTRRTKLSHIKNIKPFHLGTRGETARMADNLGNLALPNSHLNSRLRNITFPIPLTGVRRGVQRSDIARLFLSRPWNISSSPSFSSQTRHVSSFRDPL